MKTIVVTMALAALLLTGCLGGSTSTPGAVTSPTGSPTGPTSPPTRTGAAYHPVIRPAGFTTAIDNPYLPFPVGRVFVFEGTRDGVPTRTEVTITTAVRTIMGVRCIVVRDIVTSNTALVEKTTDWYAQDHQGNVWYFGEQTAEYASGAVTSTAGTWEAGVDGALPGIVMPAHPKTGTSVYRQEYRPGVAEDLAKVVSTGASAKVPAGTYSSAVVTRDTDPLNPTKLEHKTYGRGVGLIETVGVVNGHHEKTWLVSVLAAH